jgi:hypothetical protein
MSNFNDTHQLPVAARLLANISARLTIGSAVCFTEGLAATIVALLPGELTFYIGTTVITFAIWLGFLRYRDSKLGAEIGDLCLWEFLICALQLVLYYFGPESSIFWYLSTTISMVKLIRVYLWYSTATQQYGWGRFGLMTWLYAKKHPKATTAPSHTLIKEIAYALIAAVVASCLIKLLPGWGRVALSWTIPVAFEFLVGPRQLRMIDNFIPAFLATSKREAELAEENAKLKHLQATLTENPETPSRDLTELLHLFSKMSPIMQKHMLTYAKNAAEKYPAKGDTKS